MQLSTLTPTLLSLTLLTTIAATAPPQRPSIKLLGRTYALSFFNPGENPSWEFTTGVETIQNWTSLITVMDQPESKSRSDLDVIGRALLDHYKTIGGQVLTARTMKSDSGDIFNYVLAAVDEPAKKRFEINFVKIALGPKNAFMAIYGVRITDPKDYKIKAKTYLDQHSGEVGLALGTATLPAIATLPRSPGPYHP